MPRFTFSQDEKINIWNRTGFVVKADSEKEAICLLKKYRKEHICDIEARDENVTILCSEVMYDTAENMTPEENGGQATIEFYPNGKYNTESLICSNEK